MSNKREIEARGADVEKAIEELKAVVDGESAEDIKEKTDALQQASMKLGELAYRKAQEESAGETDDEAAETVDASDDDVLDADFTDLEVEDDEDDQKSA